jgi:hypothetical protein
MKAGEKGKDMTTKVVAEEFEEIDIGVSAADGASVQ